MKFVLAEPRLLKESISIISELVNEVNISIDKNRIELIAMDPANVAMVIFHMLASAFVEYSVEKETKIAINLDQFKQILRRAKPSDTLEIGIDQKDNQLVVGIKGEITRTFKLTLIEAEGREQKIPELKFSTRIELPSNLLEEAIEDMGVVAESVKFEAEKGLFSIQAESKFNAAHMQIKGDDKTSISLNGSEKIPSKYSLEYLKKIVKGAKLADMATLEFDKEYPLKTEYTIKDKLRLSFILAPRVSTD
ncbi:proliferating cell nuclear antigen (pcna) [Candidatus Woesearchaeota archaeon]|nr:proliferating cell nuclear antigen (pcna) [Candidatus Woesearchaeota archaeon]